MANKNFNKILIVIVILLVFNLIRTYAYNINSDNNPGVIVGPGGSGEAGDATNWQGNTRAIRIRVFRDGKETSYSKYYLLKNLENNCNIKQISGKICTTSGYNYSSVNNTDGSTCTDGSVSLGCLVSEGLESTWERLSSNGNVLKTYLENDNYSNLREILAQLGYNDSTFKENDIAIVEPVTYVLCANEVYFGTSTALMKQNVSYRGTSGNKCAAADNDYSKPKDGIADGNTFINVYRSMSIALKDTENNWSTNSEGKTTSTQNTNYSGFGYFKYDLSNFYSPTYKVVYHGNGGTWNGTDQWTSDPIEYNSQYAIEPNFFTRNGYAFLGWTTNSNGTDDGIGWTGWSGTWTYKNGEYGINNNELHLYARWITINGNLEITKTNSSTGGALSGVGFTLYSDSACSVVTASEKKTDSNGKVTFSNIQEGTYYYKETTIPKNYAGNTACNYVYVTAGNTNSITVTNDPYYQVKIKKVNSSGEGVINKTVNFNIYTNSGCSGDAFQSLVCHTGGDGTCLVNLPPNNNYWLKETSIDATDFVVTDDCISFGPLSSSRVNTISFTNKTKCEEDFSNNRSIVNRIKLYKTYGYRNLLNFNITKMADACSDYTPSYGRQTSCLFSNQVNSNTEEKFTDENLSDYNDSITGNSGSISYCLTDFELNRNLDIDIDGPVKAGQMLINIGGTRSLATGTIKKTCYIHNNDINKYNIVSTTPTTNFSSFNTLKNLNNGKNYSISNSDLNIYSNYFYSKYTVLHDQKNINYYIPTRELKDYTTKDFLNGCYTKGNQIFISTIKLVSEGINQ